MDRHNHRVTFTSIADLREAGFLGFISVAELFESRFVVVPDQPGVYVVCRQASGPPSFLERSPAGLHKSKDPTLPMSELECRWVPGTCVVYIGKAGGLGLQATLRSRVRAYVRLGRGRRSGHWGGRAIWQLADSLSLCFGWLPAEDPRALERELITLFQRLHGHRPFANRAS
jgi:hypothetical protein